jgi:hypothetical protein
VSDKETTSGESGRVVSGSVVAALEERQGSDGADAARGWGTRAQQPHDLTSKWASTPRNHVLDKPRNPDQGSPALKSKPHCSQNNRAIIVTAARCSSRIPGRIRRVSALDGAVLLILSAFYSELCQ